MPLTKSQKSVLKKIDAIFSRVEKFSEKTGISINDFAFDHDFQFPDMARLQEKKVNEQSRKRQQVFKLVKQFKSKVQ